MYVSLLDKECSEVADDFVMAHLYILLRSLNLQGFQAVFFSRKSKVSYTQDQPLESRFSDKRCQTRRLHTKKERKNITCPN